MNHERRRLLRAGLLSLAAGVPACGYSLSGRGSFLPVYIKKIGVPTFVNNTPVFNVEQPITEHVRSELIGRGKFTVLTDAAGVDGLLSGTIQSITTAPVAFNNQRQATRYVLMISATIEFRDVMADKVLWSNPAMQFREEFDVANAASAVDPNAFFGQDQNALNRVATEFARSIVSAILEAF